jgi:phosphatidate phosphatase APP1
MLHTYLTFFGIVFVSTTINALFDKEGLFLVPSVAFRDHSDPTKSPADWNLHNQGWYYEENPIQAFLMEKSLELIVRKDLDKNRVKMFTAEGKKKKDLCIDGLSRSMCTKTDGDGRIKNTFTVTNQEIELFRQPGGATGQVSFQASVLNNNNMKAMGEIYLCDDDGVTFISDIDDTIKITEVTSSTQTLINTFSGDFKPVPGMAEIYRHWETQYNATFAYLTASPDQLYPFLREFFDREQFPSGSAHMRHFTWLDANFITFFMSSSYMAKKTETLEMFLQNTRNRKFVLLGDIFQKDPEIYAGVYAKYPDRIQRIFIRKYADDNEGQQRLEALFKDMPREKWATFEQGADLPREISF